MGRRAVKRIALGLAALGVCATLAVFFWNLYWHVPGRIDFALHGARYRQIAQAARARLRQSTGPVGRFDIEGVAVVIVRVGPDRVTMMLLTADWGHAGKAGYAYSDDAELVRVTGDPYADVDVPGDLWKLGGEVAPHWWSVSNHLQ